MIDIISIQEDVSRLGKSGTSGYDNQVLFTKKANFVQNSLFEAMADVYEVNESASTAMGPFVKYYNGYTDDLGVISKPEGFKRLLTLWVLQDDGTRATARKIMTNEYSMISTSPVRKPKKNDTLEKAYCYFDDKINVLPDEKLRVQLLYLRSPKPVKFVATRVSDNQSDYLMPDPTKSVNFEWPSSMYNIIVYLILEQFGVEMKDQLLMEFSKYGITQEMVRTT